MTELEIPAFVFDQMVDQAKDEAPIESCGILAGDQNRVQRLYEMTNIDNSSKHFTMNPAEQFSVQKSMRAAGLDMSAIYHSHPATAAIPSKEDIQLAETPDATYVILSLEKPDKPYAKAFIIEDGTVTERPLRIVKG